VQWFCQKKHLPFLEYLIPYVGGLFKTSPFLTFENSLISDSGNSGTYGRHWPGIFHSAWMQNNPHTLKHDIKYHST
jgi:hypothetical protein